MTKKGIKKAAAAAGTSLVKTASDSGAMDTMWRTCLSSPMRAAVSSTSIISAGLVISKLSALYHDMQDSKPQVKYPIVSCQVCRQMHHPDECAALQANPFKPYLDDVPSQRASLMDNTTLLVFAMMLGCYAISGALYAINVLEGLALFLYWLGFGSSLFFCCMDSIRNSPMFGKPQDGELKTFADPLDYNQQDADDRQEPTSSKDGKHKGTYKR